MRTVRSGRRDGGSVVVETAIGLPVLLLFVFGLVDLGRWSLEANEVSNAARDGARAGIFSYQEADDEGSPDNQAIVGEVHARLQERASVVTVDVSCVGTAGTAIDCSDALADEDRIRVQVSWVLDLVTPVAGAVGRDSVTIESASTMRLTGLPTADTGTPATTTTVPPACALASGPTASPSSVTASGGGKPNSDIAISFETNDTPDCDDLTVVLTSASDSYTHSCGCGPAPTHSWTYDKSSGSFTFSGGEDVTVEVRDSGASLGSTTITVT